MAVVVTLPGTSPCTITKLKVKEGSQVNRMSILALYKTKDSDKISKLKCNHVGTVVEITTAEGQTAMPGDELLRLEGCRHATVMKDMCAECGADLRTLETVSSNENKKEAASVAMIHSIPELIVSEDQALELGRQDEKRLLKHRKLVLLVDLDQTLLHTTNDNIPPNLKDVDHFQLWHGRWMWYHTKFRPGTREFLANVSKDFELHICTFGVRLYAHTIAKFLDPDGKFFSHRILSRDECFSANSKTANLKALFPCGDSLVCIIDDRDDVWKCAPNLIHVKPYLFFDGTADINAPPGLATKGVDETEKAPRHKVTVVRVPRKNPNQSKDNDDPPPGDSIDNDDPPPGDSIEQESETGKSEEKESEVQNKSESQNTEPVGKSDGEELHETEENRKEQSSSIDDKSDGEELHETEDNRKEQSSSIDDSDSVAKTELEHVAQDLDVTDSESESETDAVSNMGNVETPKSETSSTPELVMTDTQSTADGGNETPSNIPDDVTEVLKESNKDGQTEPHRESIQTAVEVEATETTDAIKEQSELSPLNDMIVSDDSDEDVESTPKETTNTEEQETSLSAGEQDKSGEVPEEKRDSKKSMVEREEGEVTSEEDRESQPTEEYDEVVEWEDSDDYLIYLQDILKRIHTAFFEMYDESKEKDSKDIPDLKKIIPYVRKKVLKGANIVFSGVIPTNQPVEKSRLYRVATSFGANIQTTLDLDGENAEERTTHLVAAKLGTSKVHMVRKTKAIKVVNPDWLWTCSVRWEWVDERLFPLTEQSRFPSVDSPDPAAYSKKKRQKEKKKETPENGTSNNKGEDGRDRKFSDSYNPLYTFSSADIKEMDKEVEEIFDESESEDSEAELRRVVLGFGKKRRREKESSSEAESLSCDYPKGSGWGKKKRRRKSKADPSLNEDSNQESEDDGADENEEKRKIVDDPGKMMQLSDQSSNSGSDFDNSIGSVDAEIADALERELLAAYSIPP